MPNIQIADYIKQQTGIQLDQAGKSQNSQSHNARALIQAGQRLGNDLSNVLYKAVVKMDDADVLLGPPLTAQQLHTLRAVAALAKVQPSCTNDTQQILQNFEGAAKRYALFLTEGDSRTQCVSNIINKQEREARKFGTNATPRHCLNRHGNEIYEVLTWMTPSEVARLEGRFPNTQGLFSIQPERSRSRNWGEQAITEYKITLGSGGFGAARVARRVSDDQYMVFKKVHPQDVGPKPAPTPTLRGVNDGSASGVSRVYDSFMAYSTRGGRDRHVEPSAYTLSELGVIDTHKFMSIFSVMSYALNPAYETQPLAKTLRAAMMAGDSTQGTVENALRLANNPCSNPETVRQFRNTMAWQMLEAVHQMHQKDRAHNDIKPDNFVLAYDDNKLLRVKLIDFDLNASVKESVGVARNVYAFAFAAPQVSSNAVNNQADRNDAYSMGCAFRLLNGEPLNALILQRLLAKGDIRDAWNRKIKPVEDRRTIETQFIHIPEVTTLDDLVNLLCHPHSGKRYSIAQAMQSPLFTRAGNVLSPQQFSDMAEKIIRHGYLIPKDILKKSDVLPQCEQALAQQQGQTNPSPFDSMAQALSQQDAKLLLNRYVQTHGEQHLNQQFKKAEAQVASENRAATLRRGMRQLNISHHLKSAAEREAGYVYKTPKK